MSYISFDKSSIMVDDDVNRLVENNDDLNLTMTKFDGSLFPNATPKLMRKRKAEDETLPFSTTKKLVFFSFLFLPTLPVVFFCFYFYQLFHFYLHCALLSISGSPSGNDPSKIIVGLVKLLLCPNLLVQCLHKCMEIRLCLEILVKFSSGVTLNAR